jgi:hypothetical protein
MALAGYRALHRKVGAVGLLGSRDCNGDRSGDESPQGAPQLLAGTVRSPLAAGCHGRGPAWFIVGKTSLCRVPCCFLSLLHPVTKEVGHLGF